MLFSLQKRTKKKQEHFAKIEFFQKKSKFFGARKAKIDHNSSGKWFY